MLERVNLYVKLPYRRHHVQCYFWCRWKGTIPFLELLNALEIPRLAALRHVDSSTPRKSLHNPP